MYQTDGNEHTFLKVLNGVLKEGIDINYVMDRLESGLRSGNWAYAAQGLAQDPIDLSQKELIARQEEAINGRTS
jgi:hypothetical protein